MANYNKMTKAQKRLFEQLLFNMTHIKTIGDTFVTFSPYATIRELSKQLDYKRAIPQKHLDTFESWGYLAYSEKGIALNLNNIPYGEMVIAVFNRISKLSPRMQDHSLSGGFRNLFSIFDENFIDTVTLNQALAILEKANLVRFSDSTKTHIHATQDYAIGLEDYI